jgi:hypothetical protein
MEEKIKTPDWYHLSRFKLFLDGYSDTENFITIHGINSEAYARNISTVLRDNIK